MRADTSRLKSDVDRGLGGAAPSATKAGAKAGDSFAASFARRLKAGAGPGIAGLSAKHATIIAGAGAALAGGPALAAAGAAAGVAAIGARVLIGTKKAQGPLYAAAKQLGKTFNDTLQSSVKPLIGPFRAAFAQIPRFLKQIQPLLKSAFGAVGPLIGPMLHGFEALVRGLLPGLVAILKSARPAITVVAHILGSLGKALGGMLTAMAPAVKASSVVLKALGGVFTSLFPVIGKLAGIFAKALAPVLIVFAKVIKSLEPVLVIIGRVIAGLAKAVLGDLVSAFGAVAALLKGVSPALKVLANTLGSVFKVMENSGVFAILASALEGIAKPLASLVNALVVGLAPVLPPIIKLAASLAGTIVQVLVAALKAVIPILIILVKDILKPLVPLIKALAPLLGSVGKLIGVVLVAAIKLVTPLLNIVVKVLGYVAGALAAVIKWVVGLVTHWKQAWGDIKQWAKDAWDFLTHGWGQWLVPGLTLIRKVIGLVRDHWKQAWADIKSVAVGAWHLIYNVVVKPLKEAWHFMQSVGGFFGHLLGGGGGGRGNPGASPSQAASYAASRLPAYGWSPRQMASLGPLWNGESGWNRLARNATSGAYGIPQALPASKMGAAANPPVSSAVAQINWGLSYIKGRYGDPASAYSAWLSRSPHWYDKGGWLMPGVTAAVNATGRPERVLSPEQEAALARGKTVNISLGGVEIREQADIDLIARRLAFAMGG